MAFPPPLPCPVEIRWSAASSKMVPPGLSLHRQDWVPAEAQASLRLWGIVALGFASVLLVLVLAVYFFRDKAVRVAGFLVRPLPAGLSRKVLALLDDFIAGLKFFQGARTIVLYLVLSFAVWLGIIFFYWVFFISFRVSIPFFLLFPYVFLTMVGASIPTPGMVGGYHVFSREGMITLFGLSVNQAVGLTAVFHAVQYIVTCLVGFVILRTLPGW